MRPLCELVKIIKGNKAEEVYSRPQKGSFRYIQIDDLRPNAKIKYAVDKNGTLAQETDLLIAWDGANAGTVSFGLNGYIGSTIAILRPLNNDVFTPYLGYFLQSKFLEIQENTTGATIPHISRNILESLLVPLPTVSEQQRIASILQKADRLRQLRAYSHHLNSGFLQSVFLEMFGGHREVCKNEILGNIAEIVSGVTKGQNFKGRKTIEVPYLRVANVQDGYLDLLEIKTIQALPSEVINLLLKIGDILMTEGGDFDKLGRGTIWHGEIDPCIHQNHIFRVRLDNKKMIPEFFDTYLLTRGVKDYFLTASKKTTNLATINMTQLKNLPVIIPSMKEQERFVAIYRLNKHFRNQQSESMRQAEHLFQSLLARAFQGEL